MTDKTDRQARTADSFLTPRRITAGILGLMALVFVVQNRDDVTLQFLFIRLTAALWLASLTLLVIGVLIGALWTSRRKRP